MAAPTNAANLKKAPSDVGFWEKTGRHMLNASSSHFDPQRTSVPPQKPNAQTLRPSLKLN